MRIILKDGKKVDIAVKQEGETYIYYLGTEKIGAFNPKIMQDNILILKNTLENELSSQIKEAINQMDRGEIQNDAKENREIDTYIRELGQRGYTVKEVRKIELKNPENQKEEKEKESKEQEVSKNEKKELTTTKDVNIKQEFNVSERANDMHDIKKWLGGRVPDDVQKIGVIYSDDMKNIKNEDGKSYRKKFNNLFFDYNR